jgi:hypothetical protein
MQQPSAGRSVAQELSSYNDDNNNDRRNSNVNTANTTTTATTRAIPHDFYDAGLLHAIV